MREVRPAEPTHLITTKARDYAGERKEMNGFKFNWKWGMGIGGVVVLLLLIDHNPGLLKRASKLVRSADSRFPGREKVTAAELSGKLDRALLLAMEEKERLTSYQSQFQCPDGQLLDSLFFSGALQNHVLRPVWWEMRRELPEFVKKHDALISELHKARSCVGRGESIETWQDLPEEAEEASQALDQAIKERNRKVFQFAVLVNQVKAQIAIQERRSKR